MRICLVLLGLLALAACDLRPAPPKSEPVKPPPTPAAVPVAADAAVPDALADNVPTGSAGSASLAGSAAAVDVTPECVTVGEHIAAVWIDSAHDVAEKAALTQDRAKLVRKSAEACTQLKWTDAARSCYLAAKTVPELGACGAPK